MTLSTPDIERLKGLLEKATPGPWELQDGCSWRRIGTRHGNGDVLCPYNSRSDNHPDLTAGRGQDLYANLNLIVAASNALPALISDRADLEAELDAAHQATRDSEAAADSWLAEHKMSEARAQAAEAENARLRTMLADINQHRLNIKLCVKESLPEVFDPIAEVLDRARALLHEGEK